MTMTAPDIIRSICPLPESSMLRLAGQLEEISCPKGTFILKAGNVERSVFFVRKGIVRAFIEHGGREITFWFGLEGAAVVSLKSYVNGQPGYETVECLEDTSLYVLRRDALKFAEIEFLSTEEKFIPMLFTTASERYRDLLKNRPELLQRVSLECLASYLGITAQSLSRIRAGIR